MAASAHTLPDGAWLHGRAADLLLGAGAGYLIAFPLLLWLATVGGAAGWPILCVVAFSFFVGAPHYGATLLRVYEQRADRRRYAIFAVHATILLALAFVWGATDLLVGSLLLTVYVTWSPWHVSGQNYGVALMFLRRRGVPIPPLAKRLLYASFILSFLLAALSMHVVGASVLFASGAPSGADNYEVLRLGVPKAVWTSLAPVLLAAYLAATIGSLALLSRGAAASDLGPVGSLILTQALWFAVPTALSFWRADAASLLPFAAIWISAMHGAQYLWVTSYYARRADPRTRTGPYLARTLLAGTFVTVVPAMLLAPALSGSVPWNAGLGALLFAVVNIHHFVLDGAVWKLRDGRVARALLRTDDDPDRQAALAPERPGALWRLVWIAGALALGVGLYEQVERQITLKRTAGEPGRARAALDRLSLVGRDSPRDRVTLGRVYARRGDAIASAAQYRRSLELYASTEAWLGLAQLHAAASEWESALAAGRSALEIDPDHVAALVATSSALLRLEGRAGPASGANPSAAAARHRREAIETLERAIALRPDQALLYHDLARAYEREGRSDDAAELIETALARVAPKQRATLRRELRRLSAGEPAPPGPAPTDR